MHIGYFCVQTFSITYIRCTKYAVCVCIAWDDLVKGVWCGDPTALGNRKIEIGNTGKQERAEAFWVPLKYGVGKYTHLCESSRLFLSKLAIFLRFCELPIDSLFFITIITVISAWNFESAVRGNSATAQPKLSLQHWPILTSSALASGCCLFCLLRSFVVV